MEATFHEEASAHSGRRDRRLRRIVVSHLRVWSPPSSRCRERDAFRISLQRGNAADESFQRQFLLEFNPCLCTISCVCRLRLAGRAAVRRRWKRIIFLALGSYFPSSRAGPLGVMIYHPCQNKLARAAAGWKSHFSDVTEGAVARRSGYARLWNR